MTGETDLREVERSQDSEEREEVAVVMTLHGGSNKLGDHHCLPFRFEVLAYFGRNPVALLIKAVDDQLEHTQSPAHKRNIMRCVKYKAYVHKSKLIHYERHYACMLDDDW